MLETTVSAAQFTQTLDWLLNAEEPWVVYNALTDLARAGPSDPRSLEAYRQRQQHPQVAALVEALDCWPSEKPLKGAYDPKDAIWKLGTLADFGLRRGDARIEAIAGRVFSAQTE